MNTVEHLVFSLVIWISSFVKSLLHPLMNFSAGLSVSFLFTCRFLYTLDKTFDHIFMLKNILSIDNKPP